MTGYRRVEKIPVEGCNVPGPPPKMLWLNPRQLVINEEYQRALTKESLKMIREMARDFQWDNFKALSVASTDHPDVYEVVDGQHTAIAALSNGTVDVLPCFLQSGLTLRDKARGFLGINLNRKNLSSVSIFNARVAAQDEDAIAVQCAIDRAGVTLWVSPPKNGIYKVGETAAVGALMSIAKKKGDARLSTILRVAVLAGAAPVSALLIKALDIVVDEKNREQVVTFLKRQGIPRLEVRASRDVGRGAAYVALADAIKAGLRTL